MKCSIFSLSIVSAAALALCHCTADSTAATTATPAISAPPVVDLAPQSVKGKRIVLKYDKANRRDEYAQNQFEFKDGNENLHHCWYEDGELIGDDNYYAEIYKKTGNNTAVITYESYHVQGRYELMFDTPTSGTVRCKIKDDVSDEGGATTEREIYGATFTIIAR